MDDQKTQIKNVEEQLKARQRQCDILSQDNLQQRADLSKFVDLTNKKFKDLNEDISVKLHDFK